MIVFALVAAISLATATAAAPPLLEVDCSAVVQAEGGPTTVVNDEGLKVLEQTRAPGDFAYRRENARAIRCERTDLVPASNDYKVLLAGFPLYIVQSTSGDSRIGVLEVSGGQFRFRMIQGELNADEQTRMVARLNEMQEASRTPR